MVTKMTSLIHLIVRVDFMKSVDLAFKRYEGVSSGNIEDDDDPLRGNIKCKVITSKPKIGPKKRKPCRLYYQ